MVKRENSDLKQYKAKPQAGLNCNVTRNCDRARVTKACDAT